MVDASSALLTEYGEYVKQAAKEEKPDEGEAENPEGGGEEKPEEEEQSEADEEGDVEIWSLIDLEFRTIQYD